MTTPSLSRSHAATLTQTHTHIHTHFLSHRHTLFSLSFSFSLTHLHTHTLFLSLFLILSLTHTLSLSFSLSLSHTQTHTHPLSFSFLSFCDRFNLLANWTVFLSLPCQSFHINKEKPSLNKTQGIFFVLQKKRKYFLSLHSKNLLLICHKITLSLMSMVINAELVIQRPWS